MRYAGGPDRRQQIYGTGGGIIEKAGEEVLMCEYIDSWRPGEKPGERPEEN